MGKHSRKVGQAVRREIKVQYSTFFNRLCCLPFRERLKASWRILFKRGFNQEQNHGR
ncbi:hypothetical protein PDESU_03326 [Pontiella desulfatans]|uniref:Uncharacterized protein n=1 Tax=Pontiella desulfatans TaxID=2750659 RepID=A0A6C2U4L0_PONDE|nr:hypothetical protein PDESU_03326 [Pontiella desulfatans]